MSEIDDILEKCLRDLVTGASSPEECLARYPEHAAQLEPLLLTASRVATGRKVRPSPAFKARARATLTLHMQANPHRVVRPSFNFRRLAAGLAALVLALLATGTVYAQGSLPGDSLYRWKLASERAWRLVSPDTVNTDFAIANRRINELNATANDPTRRAQALEGYREVRERLKSEIDAETLENILPSADSFDNPDLLTPSPNSNGNGNGTPHTKEPKPTHQTVPIGPTKKPKLIPTIEVPPPIN